MKKKCAIYTKTGDQGKTGLLSGERVQKDTSLIQIYGSIDELSSQLSICTNLENILAEEMSERIKFIQVQLFHISSLFACAPEKWNDFNLKCDIPGWLQILETSMDDMDSFLPKLKNFIMPGSSLLSAHLHVARCKTRNVEREIVRYLIDDVRYHEILKYFNRLSDYFFVLARYVDVKQGKPELILS